MRYSSFFIFIGAKKMHTLLRPLMTGLRLKGNVPSDVPLFLKSHGHAQTAVHCEAVAEEAGRLATIFEINVTQAKLAGWLHDISTVFPVEERVEIAQALEVDILPEEKIAPMILHQKLSAILARQIFGVEDEAVLQAVACHTTLRAGATPLDKVVFVADKVAWDQSGVPPYQAALLEALTHSLDAAALCYLSYLWERRETLLVVHPWMAEAYADLSASAASFTIMGG
jgi:predicted HD superfamily hydrolase involved in NAD metabolism